MNSCVFLVLLLYIQISYAVIYKLIDDEYELMPPVIHLDPFEKCLRRPDGRYCTAHVNFVSDSPSALLKQMQEYSEHTATHLNHTRSIYGICLSHKCVKFYDNYTEDLGNSLEACLNDSLWKKYNLKVRLEEDIWCIGYNEKRPNIGVVEIAVASVLLSLVVCNVIGSVYDIFLTKQDNGLVAQFLVCFSLPRNWKRLIAPPQHEDPRLNRFKGIHGIRAISMTTVIIAHALLPIVIVSEYPKFVEEQYEMLPSHIFLNGTLIMQTFFFLSAFLLVYNSLIYAETKEISWRMLPMCILLRWLRLTPSYALVLAVVATWMRHISNGPLWNIAVVEEAVDCRRNWWKNLLYINNYENNSLCIPHAWYIAADTQLYCLGAIVFVFCQSPRSRKIFLPILFVIGLIIPALHTYYQDLDGTLIVSPSAAASFFTYDDTFNNVYKRGHTNIPCYIMGMAFGYLVYNLHMENFDASKYRRWRPLYWLLFIIGISITLVCKLLYEGPRLHLYYRVLLSFFVKPIFGLVVGLIIVGTILKIDDFYRGILEWRGWTPLARLSYSAYLLHLPLIRTLIGLQTHTIQNSILRASETNLHAVMVTYVAATMFWLTVEAPLAQLVKTCISSHPNPRRGWRCGEERN